MCFFSDLAVHNRYVLFLLIFFFIFFPFFLIFSFFVWFFLLFFFFSFCLGRCLKNGKVKLLIGNFQIATFSSIILVSTGHQRSKYGSGRRCSKPFWRPIIGLINWHLYIMSLLVYKYYCNIFDLNSVIFSQIYRAKSKKKKNLKIFFKKKIVNEPPYLWAYILN